jgi:hypothetical protein
MLNAVESQPVPITRKFLSGKKLQYLFSVFCFVFLISSVSFSQDNEYEHYSGIYKANIKTSVSSINFKENINIEGLLVYQTEESKYLLCLSADIKGWLFNILKTEFTIDIDLDTETIKYKIDPEHTAIDWSGICFDVPKEDLLKYNDSKRVVANVYLLKGDENKDNSIEIPVKIDLKPEETKVYLDFYNLSLKDIEKK